LIQMNMDLRRFAEMRSRLGEAALDPTIWPEIMEQISTTLGATGAVLLQSDIRTPDVPRTRSLDGLARRYFGDGWATRDVRGNKGIPLLARGAPVIIDQDFVTSDQMQRDPFYNDCLIAEGFEWFAGVGFRAGSALWILTFQRTHREGAFDPSDKGILAQLSQPMTEAASLSKAVGRVVLSGITNALDLVREPALVLDRMGFVLDANPRAERLFDDEFRIRERRIYIRDQRASAALNECLEKLRAIPDVSPVATAPVVVHRYRRRPVVIRALPIPGAVRSPFLGARALIILRELGPRPAPDPELLSTIFGMTHAESRLASLIAVGLSPQQAATELRVSPATVRNQLKAVFAKTGAHRQSELAALIASLAF
jgi:DNA-binding CsgD family transcriptional regulator